MKRTQIPGAIWFVPAVLLAAIFAAHASAQAPTTQQTLSKTEIEALLRQEWLPTLPWESVEIEQLEIPQDVVLPAGEVRLTVETTPRTNLSRPFFARVNFQINGRVVRNAFYKMQLGVYDTVPVTAKQLSPADKVESDDVRWERRRLDSTLTTVVQSPEFFEGKKLRTTIQTGQALTEDLFIKAQIIKRGDEVVMVYEDNRIRVTTQGKSLAAGGIGDRVRILNVDSKKEVLAEIIDDKTVRVNF
jgi:flagella basal body P-ring formation protein FlgA